MGCNSCKKKMEVVDVRLLDYLAKAHIFKSLAQTLSMIVSNYQAKN